MHGACGLRSVEHRDVCEAAYQHQQQNELNVIEIPLWNRTRIHCSAPKYTIDVEREQQKGRRIRPKNKNGGRKQWPYISIHESRLEVYSVCNVHGMRLLPHNMHIRTFRVALETVQQMETTQTDQNRNNT